MIILTDELLLNYKRCSRRTYLEVYGSQEAKDPQKEFLLKLRKENKQHIQSFIHERSLFPQKPLVPSRNWLLESQETLALMKQGADCIYHGTLALSWQDWQKGINDDKLKPSFPFQLNLEKEDQEPEITVVNQLLNKRSNLNFPNQDVTLFANPTFLIKQPGKSIFGDWSYISLNVKLGRRPKPEYKLISAYHAQILAIIQDEFPARSPLILRHNNEYEVNLIHWLDRTRDIVANCLEMLYLQVEPEVFISRQKCNLCHWYTYCHQQAKAKKHLSLVPGITPKRYESLKDIGLDNLELIASTSDRVLEKRIGQEVARQLKQQARALLLNTALIKADYNLEHSYQLPSAAIELYFDIEAEPDRNLDYLLGILLVDHINNTQEFFPFLAEKIEEEEKVWREFFDFMMTYSHAPVFHFSGYEVDTIKRLAALYETPKIQTKALLSRCVDIHHWVTKSVILPVESYSLKSLANWLGFQWRDETASGDQSVCWYDNWLNTQDRSLLNAILSYNEDDCYATYYLKDWLVKFFLEAQKRQAL